MSTVITMLSLVILLLTRLYFSALKRLKSQKHNSYNIKQFEAMKNELWDKNFELKRKATLLEWRLEEHRKEIIRQQKINYIIVRQYNNIRESVIDVPLKHGRFFDIHIEKENLLLSFSEN